MSGGAAREGLTWRVALALESPTALDLRMPLIIHNPDLQGCMSSLETTHKVGSDGGDEWHMVSHMKAKDAAVAKRYGAWRPIGHVSLCGWALSDFRLRNSH